MSNEPRLLPWTGPEGNPAYVVGDGTGRVSRLADEIEGLQLGMADELLAHAATLLAEPRVTGGELRYIAGCLSDSLRDVKRVAESRGARLGQGNSTSDSRDLLS
ncbi:hypothetical protein [Streptomyces caeruleatus]|uniref:Uncharacterized protein n=1 Tax=Streptomyces caeruleatus TaxID=661399 RepID=A0A101U1Q9_9ACTN|nr:hypothetical protein [Streptomyces caeruleatus]KUO02519.1 hypothetical protein AQJ67_22075 [Streptomyces caeruleatus]